VLDAFYRARLGHSIIFVLFCLSLHSGTTLSMGSIEVMANTNCLKKGDGCYVQTM
jgi:hypothetical protein